MYRCPRCGATGAFEIAVTTHVVLVQPEDDPEALEIDDSELNGDREWCETSAMRCLACDYDAVEADFAADRPPAAPAPA